MTRDELIEKMARAICNHWKNANYYGDQWPEVSSRLTGQADDFRAKAQAVLTAIEAAGLCIVPREATDAIENAMLDTGLVEDGIPRKSASDCAQTVYRAALLRSVLV